MICRGSILRNFDPPFYYDVRVHWTSLIRLVSLFFFTNCFLASSFLCVLRILISIIDDQLLVDLNRLGPMPLANRIPHALIDCIGKERKLGVSCSVLPLAIFQHLWHV